MVFILENFKGSEISGLAQILATSMNSNKVGILIHRPEVRRGCWATAAMGGINSELKSLHLNVFF